MDLGNDEGEAAGAVDGGGARAGYFTPLDGELWQRPRDGGGRVVWERPNVRFSEALCSLGLVRYVDMYGGTDEEGVGYWLEW